ncbi:MAG: LPS export ABC transporter periplasmic protein LptC [Betaproteobacteria bacterium]
MKQWGSALFPLTILFALAGLTFWLRVATELPEIRHDGKHRHDPDYIVTSAQLRKIDETGKLKYTLKATDIKHYPDDDTTDLSQPDLVFLNPKKSTLTLTSDLAHMSKDGEQVDLYGNVRIVRAATAKDPAMIATTPELTVFPDEDKAFTKSPVLITQGKSLIKGVGLQMDNRAQTYILESNASAVLESKHAPKTTP